MYATIDEIKASSKRVPQVLVGTPSDFEVWMDEAANAIHTFCSQNFVFEPHVSKRVSLFESTLAVLPKYLSGKVTVTTDGGDLVTSTNLTFDAGDLTVVLNNNQGRGLDGNVGEWSTSYRRTAQFLNITGDWGYAPSQEYLLLAYANDLKTRYNAHRLDTEAHIAADNTNVILSADATDLSTAIVLLNELLEVINDHFADTSVHTVADSNISVSVSATDERSALSLARELDKKWLAHLATGPSHLTVPNTNQRTIASVDALVMPNAIKRTFIRLVQRIAVRDDDEDFYNRNIGYQSEKTGDSYDYDLSNGTLRNLIRPEDFQVLHYHVNDGIVVA
jgi:hypothetical protein